RASSSTFSASTSASAVPASSCRSSAASAARASPPSSRSPRLPDMRDQFLEQALTWAPTVAVALAIFLVSWVCARLAHSGIHRVAARTSMHASLAFLLARMARVGLLLLGTITAAGTLGINITGIVAGLGLTGFALGFALKDSIANLLAGVMILIYRPFEPGDRIECAGFI